VNRILKLDMNPEVEIKSYRKPEKRAQQYPLCHVCGRPARFRAKCDNCHQIVCHRHRPAFVTPWYCSKCLEMWNQWRQNNPEPAEETIQQMAMAESLIADNRIVEANKIIDDIVKELV